MAEGILHTDIDPAGKDTEVINSLVHDIQNDLQVIMIASNLLFTEERSKRGAQCAFDAVQDIEKLLGEVRQYFLLRR